MAKARPLGQLSSQELSLWCDQIALMLRAGIALYDAAGMLRESYAGTALEPKLAEIDRKIRESGSLYEAMQEAGCFPAYAVYMVRVGERSGNLEAIMTALSDYYAWEHKVRGAIRSAVFYPAVLVAMMAVVILVLITFVFPVFTQVYESMGVGMTGSSQLAIRVALGFGRGVLAVALLLAVGIAVVALLMRTRRRERVLQALLRAFPPARRAMEKIESGRIALALSMLLTGGYPLEEALELVQDVLTAPSAREKVRVCCEEIRSGASFAQAMEHARLFEPMYVQMCRVGLSAGQIDTVMKRLCEIYDEETDAEIRRLVSYIEPTLVGVLSVVAGAILLSVMLPLMSLMSSML
ncbi:MAG TPA: type II secretion system F family protein [Candidatus Onthenecus intestinigallinarum]|uniref:Type II secretion system F family protein n=1 Tax=Candidatus Onthenecus intestinigallinarum TaxID=2840875 RepID=A0A9D1CRJ6_9FIRM|nr:type II secretion system F family protein [Candidatus Onthenecus intestinigallinarum]